MDESYSPSGLVELLHQFPHFTFKLSWLHDPEFSFDDPEYMESLVVVALMPLVILVLSMLGFLIYYCCVKIKRATPNKMNSSSCYCSVCLVIIFVMVALGGLSVIVYGTIEVHEGITAVTEATSKINKSFSVVSNELDVVDNLLQDMEVSINKLNEMKPNDTEVMQMASVVRSLQSLVLQLPYQDENEGQDDLGRFIFLLTASEHYRTIVTFSLIGLQSLVCILALIGICFRSRCFLITTVFLGLICLVISYLYIGTDLMVDVAIADMCMDPYNYVLDLAVNELHINNITAEYFLTCPSDLAGDSLNAVVSNATEQLRSFDNFIVEVADEASDQTIEILDQVNIPVMDLEKSLETLSKYLNCDFVYVAVKEIVVSVCSSTFEGLFLLCVATLSVCFAVTVVMCAAPQTWKRFSKKKATEDLDLDDVFLPPARQPSVSRTNNPLYISPEERYSRRINSNPTPPVATNTGTLSFFRQSEEDVTLIEQPPPAYAPPSPQSNY